MLSEIAVQGLYEATVRDHGWNAAREGLEDGALHRRTAAYLLAQAYAFGRVLGLPVEITDQDLAISRDREAERLADGREGA